MADQDVRERIKLANEQMSITDACRFIGMAMGDFEIASVKTYCPFGELMHEDGGRSKAFRVYPGTNSAWCFACQVYYTPVKLVATDRDVSDAVAAEVILEETGFVAPDFASRWDAALTEAYVTDLDGLANALKTACSRMVPDWETRQFDEDVAAKLRQCLSISAKVKTDDEAREWLRVTKLAMAQTLKSESRNKET